MVFTEGEKTEVSYIGYWTRLNRGNINVDISDRHGVPWTLVNEAARMRREDRQRGGGENEYWCVFDVNRHPRIPDSIRMARDNRINLVVSNPCLELWFILHFEEQNAHIERRDAQNRSRQLLAWHKKTLPGQVLESLADRYEDAKNRAIMLDKKHQGDDRPPRSNPSSDVWRLVDRLRG